MNQKPQGFFLNENFRFPEDIAWVGQLPKIYYIFNLRKVMWTALLLLDFIFDTGFEKSLRWILTTRAVVIIIDDPCHSLLSVFLCFIQGLCCHNSFPTGLCECVCSLFMLCEFCNLWALDGDGKYRNFPCKRMYPKLFWENTQGIKIYIFN